MTQEQLPPIFLKVVRSAVEAHPDKDVVDLLGDIVNVLAASHSHEFIEYLKEVPLPEDEGPFSVLIEQLKLATEELLQQFQKNTAPR
jgi:hypothetical protein